ncbi:MAG TPA: type II secretion system protein GspC [Kofleriaceae bacterium]|nr:type II secretion system protein GspC [Kofleriaceae bacterium]
MSVQDYVRRYFWVTSVLAVILCSALAAKAVNHWLEGRYLADRAEPGKAPAMLPSATAPRPSEATQNKSGDTLVSRNIFCSECAPPEPTNPVATDSEGLPPLTQLTLTLVATNLALDENWSFATIRNDTTQSRGAYRKGDIIPDAGEVTLVTGKYVVFKNTKNSNALERIALFGSAPPKPVAVAEESGEPKPKGDDLLAEVEAGIKKVDDSNFEVDRGLVDKALANPMAFAKGARVVPAIKNGKPNGFKLYAIRPNSAFAKLGLMNGDTVTGVNGMEITTAEKGLEIYQKVREQNNISISVTRRGKPVTINYTIR